MRTFSTGEWAFAYEKFIVHMPFISEPKERRITLRLLLSRSEEDLRFFG